MKRARTFGGALLALGVAIAGWLPAGTANAAEPTSSTLCVLSVHETATPGYSLAPNQGHNVNTGGQITCTGTLGGKRLAGKAGVVAWDVQYGTRGLLGLTGTCLTDSGGGPIAVNLPATDGTSIPLTGVMSYVNLGPEGLAQGTLGPYSFLAFLQSVLEPGHLDETCATKPLQNFTTVGPFVLSPRR